MAWSIRSEPESAGSPCSSRSVETCRHSPDCTSQAREDVCLLDTRVMIFHRPCAAKKDQSSTHAGLPAGATATYPWVLNNLGYITPRSGGFAVCGADGSRPRHPVIGCDLGQSPMEVNRYDKEDVDDQKPDCRGGDRTPRG